MKTKGIPFWEQNLEYIVLGIAVLVFAGFGALQLIGSSASIEYKGDSISAGDIDKRLEEEADLVWARMNPSAEATVKLTQPESKANEFNTRITDTIVPSTTLALAQEALVISSDIVDVTGDVEFYVPQIPAPHTLVSAQHFDAIDPGALDVYETLTSIFEPSDTDCSWITIGSQFDMQRVLEEQFRNPDLSGNDEMRPVPTSWFGNKLLILDVIVERQEMTDGVWSNLVELTPLETRLNIRDALAAPADVPYRDRLIDGLGQEENQIQVIQPTFYPTVNNSWTPPSDEVVEEEDPEIELTPEQEAIRRATQKYDRQKRKCDRLAAELEAAGGPLTGPDPDEDDGPGTGGGGGGSPFGDGGGLDPTKDNDDKRAKSRRRGLTIALAREMKRLERAQAELENLIGVLEPDVEEVEAMLWDRNPVKIWAHDMTVEPGVEYRYRFRLKTLNPFFGRGLQLTEAQQRLATNLVQESEASDWSDPIMVAPPIRFYATKAVLDGGSTNAGQATFEIFRFEQARWWSQTFKVEPGELVGGVAEVENAAGAPGMQTIDFSTEYVVADIVRNSDADAKDNRGQVGTVLLWQPERNSYELRVPLFEHRSRSLVTMQDTIELQDSGSAGDPIAP